MAWTGKAVGAGLGALILGPVGAAIGGVAGHWFDENRENQIPDDVRWRLAILSVYATAAAANGEFHPNEHNRLHFLANAMFEGYPPHYADQWLSTVEQAAVPLKDCGDLVRHLPDDARQRLILDLLSVLYADGKLDEAERNWLQQLVQCSGTSPDLWIQCWAFFERGETKSQRLQALGVLGLAGECTDQEIKLAYRQACLEYHPDRLGNLSAPIRRLAEEKLQQLNAAYRYLQAKSNGQGLCVVTATREIKALVEVSEREVVFCPLCETQNRLPKREHHHTCRCGSCHALLAVPTDFFPNNMNTFSGWYVGTCTNTNVSVSANLLLVIHGTSGGTMHGELGLSGKLGGGGPFHGTIQGETFVFTTCLPAEQMVIEWRGELSETTISGTYSVASDNPQLIADGLGQQAGVWSCSFVRKPGSIDPKSDSVWVFDDGKAEGPITMAEFNQQAGSGRWPDKAIVALDDRTAWTTVGEILNTKTTSEN